MSAVTHETTWYTIRGTLLHRAVLHPATYPRSVNTAALRTQYQEYSAQLAAVIVQSLTSGDFERARLAVSAGGPSWGSVVDDFQKLSRADRIHTLEDFDSSAANMATTLMVQANRDNWQSFVTEMASPTAFLNDLPYAGERIDIVAKRAPSSSAVDRRPAVVIADLKTGAAHAEPAVADEFVEDVAHKYGTWLATETGCEVECMVMYAKAKNGFSQWSEESIRVTPGQLRPDQIETLETAYGIAQRLGNPITLEALRVLTPNTMPTDVLGIWLEGRHPSSASWA